ncbi:MAG: F0F1 ATP synthase subunit gamma [Candidatus Omnitrophica bacterium]|nr:F0F1 ATP synthase subunit gamma [Candidatus Omnitrophota bacterium]
MLQLLKIKKNMEFNQRLCSILETLKSISVFQYHLLEQKLNVFEPFGQVLDSFFGSIDLSAIRHPFLGSDEGKVGIVAITSDQGLLGGLNMRVVSAAINTLETRGGSLVIIGEQGKSYARHSKVPFVAFPGVKEDVRYQQAIEVRDYLFEQLQEGLFNSIKVVHARSLSLVTHRLEISTLLPLAKTENQKNSAVDMSQLILESPLVSILEYLAYLWVGQRLGDIFGLSRLAEMGARFAHLEESTQRIEEVNKKLKMQYFKFRHENIDQSMRELFGTRMLYGE